MRRHSEKCPTTSSYRKDMQYLYADDDFIISWMFETYDRLTLPKDEVGDAPQVCKRERDVQRFCTHQGAMYFKPLSLKLMPTETEHNLGWH